MLEPLVAPAAPDPAETDDDAPLEADDAEPLDVFKPPRCLKTFVAAPMSPDDDADPDSAACLAVVNLSERLVPLVALVPLVPLVVANGTSLARLLAGMPASAGTPVTPP